MNYLIIFVLLLVAELVYFKIADKFNIIDKPNERSSHSTIVLRGGGVIFSLAMVAWAGMMAVQGDGQTMVGYLPFLVTASCAPYSPSALRTCFSSAPLVSIR